MGELTKAQEARLLLGRAIYWALWAPAVLIAAPFALGYWALEWLAEKGLPKAGETIQPIFGWWHSVALCAGNAVFGKAGRAALTTNPTEGG